MGSKLIRRILVKNQRKPKDEQEVVKIYIGKCEIIFITNLIFLLTSVLTTNSCVEYLILNTLLSSALLLLLLLLLPGLMQ